MVAPMIKGRRLDGKFQLGMRESGSGRERSFTQRKDAPRNSMALPIMKKKPKNTGIWISVGRQPLIGLILCSFQNSIIFRCALTGSSLYFSCTALICGCNACIRLAERVLAWVSGQKTTLIMTVMTTMAQP